MPFNHFSLEADNMKKPLSLIWSTLFLLNTSTASATFYDASTLAHYCQEHLKFVQLDASSDRLEAGICQGYLASKIEVMTLSQELCQRDSLDMNKLAADFVAYVVEEQSRATLSATRAVIQLLQGKHGCTSE